MSKVQQFIIPGQLIGLNEYTGLNRTDAHAGNKAKHQMQAVICVAIRKARIQKIRGPVRLRYCWYERDRRRDKDNIAFGQKFIQDALVTCGVIPGDGWMWVDGFDHDFAVDKGNPRVVVQIQELETT